jgi:hypothetical protein
MAGTAAGSANAIFVTPPIVIMLAKTADAINERCVKNFSRKLDLEFLENHLLKDWRRLDLAVAG